MEHSTPLERIVRCALRLQGDDLELLACLAERIKIGESCYGTMQIDRDPRNFVQEATEEILDATIYLAAALLRKERRECQTTDSTG